MGIELAPVTEKLKLPTGYSGWELLIATADYGLSVEELGIAQSTYMTDAVRGRKEGTYGIFVWTVLTPQVNEDGLNALTRRKISQLARALREEVAGFGLPLEIYTSVVRPEREQALRKHLARNKISYSY